MSRQPTKRARLEKMLRASGIPLRVQKPRNEVFWVLSTGNLEDPAGTDSSRVWLKRVQEVFPSVIVHGTHDSKSPSRPGTVLEATLFVEFPEWR